MEYKDIIEILYREHATQIQRMCYLYLGDEALAEDAMQETFVKVYRSYRKFHNKSSVKTWITRIAINTCKDMLRGASRLPEMKSQEGMENCRLEKAVGFEEAAYGNAENHIIVSAAIRRLPVNLREVVLLFYYQELSTKEIAGIVNVTRTTVEFRLKQARNILQKELKGDYFYE